MGYFIGTPGTTSSLSQEETIELLPTCLIVLWKISKPGDLQDTQKSACMLFHDFKSSLDGLLNKSHVQELQELTINQRDCELD